MLTWKYIINLPKTYPAFHTLKKEISYEMDLCYWLLLISVSTWGNCYSSEHINFMKKYHDHNHINIISWSL
jgi:hypothetical protein